MRGSAFAIAMAGIAGVPAMAQAAPMSLQIAPQRLDSALEFLARSGRIQILFTADVVGARTTHGVRGRMAPLAALRQLLAGTGLTYTPSGSGYVIVAAQTQPKPPAAAAATPAPTPRAAAEADAPAADAQTAETAAPTADVIVTGSRTATNGNDQPTPVTAVSTAQLARTTPSNIADGLNKLPIFVGSTSNTNTGNATTNASGNYLNLRGLGAIRTLILLDGHRVAPTAANGTVDVNTLPELLVRRVDVVTGGASAVYGSDAVTGVVNFVLDDKFTGVKALAQGGITSRGDNGQYRFGLAAGKSFDDGRLHLEASYEYFNENGIISRQDRPTTSDQTGIGGAGTAANPYQVFSSYHNSNQSYGGLIRTGPLAGMQFTSAGTLVPFVNGTATGTSGTQNGGDGTWQNGVTLAAKLRTQKAFARADADLGPVQAYVQGSYSDAYNFTAQQYLSFNPVILAATNAFLTPAQQAALSATGAPLSGGVPTFSFGKLFTDQSLATIRAYTTNYNVAAGLRGKLIGDLRWDVYASRSKSSQHVIYDGNNNNGREYASIDAVVDPATGSIVCRVSLTNPGLYPGCIPLNPFASVAGNAAAVAYIRGTTEFRLGNKMDDVAGTISGRLFDTWAGPVTVALSGESRRLTLTNRSSAQPTDPLVCTGLRFNCTATSVLWGGNVTSNVTASERISEGAFEATVPLLRGLSFAKSVELNGAVRFAHYSVSGDATTWKVGGTWQVDDQLTVRATRSRDLRAPTLYDLYQPVTQNQSTFSDVHTGVSVTVPTRTFGNPNLQPEISYTTTAGIVVRPSFLPRFSFAFDYYDINVTNVIALVAGSSSATQALCEASNGTSPVCALYVRPLAFSNRTAANFPTAVLSQPLNTATTHERGLDAEINYGLPLNTVSGKLGGRLDFRLMTTYQPFYKSRLFDTQALVNSAGIAGVPPGNSVALSLPKVRATIMVDYGNGPLELGTQVRWRSSLGRNGDPSVTFIGADIPAYAVVDLHAAYKFTLRGAHVQSFVTVQNAFDNVAKGFASTAGVGPFVPGDDIYGTTFTAGLRLGF